MKGISLYVWFSSEENIIHFNAAVCSQPMIIIFIFNAYSVTPAVQQGHKTMCLGYRQDSFYWTRRSARDRFPVNTKRCTIGTVMCRCRSAIYSTNTERPLPRDRSRIPQAHSDLLTSKSNSRSNGLMLDSFVYSGTGLTIVISVPTHKSLDSPYHIYHDKKTYTYHHKAILHVLSIFGDCLAINEAHRHCPGTKTKLQQGKDQQLERFSSGAAYHKPITVCGDSRTISQSTRPIMLRWKCKTCHGLFTFEYACNEYNHITF